MTSAPNKIAYAYALVAVKLRVSSGVDTKSSGMPVVCHGIITSKVQLTLVPVGVLHVNVSPLSLGRES